MTGAERSLPAVVLVRPQEEGNVGAAARAMANMGLDRLLLVEPAVSLGRVARAFAVKAGHVLDGSARLPSLSAALAPYPRVVGTTSSRHRRLGIPLLTPRELARWLDAEPPAPTALVFGPEASGLTNDELALCSRLVRIPAALRQPTLNLAQAVLVLAYELYVLREEPSPEGGPGGAPGPEGRAPETQSRLLEGPATSAEVEGLFRQLEPLLQEVGFARDDTFPGVLRDLRQLAARAGLHRREVALLRGICRRTEGTLSRLRRQAEGGDLRRR